MHNKDDKPQALFLFPDGKLLSDDLVCSGISPSGLEGKPCPFSEGGRMPRPQPIDEASKPRLGQSGELVPPCAVEYFGSLDAWQSAGEVRYPEALGSLKVYKCRQMFLLVVPGLRED
ncbi:MAG: hypothetical protein E3J37_01975 [Anaerolineales bacterium]|nr:MAG: hypothetical protein E3J37_01975 [Anaerolineales bacterium]